MDDADLRQATKAHYEKYPFIEGGSRRTELWRARLRHDLPDEIIKGQVILDAGCGTGEVAASLRLRGAQTLCVDLTRAAVICNRSLHPDVIACQGNVLSLPFSDNAFDHCVSIGVLHHTPDCRRGLAELTRVTRPGGRVVVLLYAARTPYHLAYGLTSGLRRRTTAGSLDRLPDWSMRLIGTLAAGFIRQRLDRGQLTRMIADQFWTPQATFHSTREVRSWASALGLQVLGVRHIPLYSNVFVFARR
jgi:ubiquinone/menaquinone biosynthesis C-methylase UbiE